MPSEPRVDAYIEKSAAFAQPILRHLRDRVNLWCPEAVEAIKWGIPAWVYRGELLCSMAAFKAHATFGFWRGKDVTGEQSAELDAMGQFGRMTSLDDVPDDARLKALLEKAMALVDGGEKAKRVLKHPKPELAVPPEFRAALDTNPGAAAHFDRFAPGQRRDYLEWITEAKRPETRDKRIAQAVEWIADGKTRHWKYQNC